MDRLIPRELLFGNPDLSHVMPSPDGRHLAYLAPLGGVMNIFVAPMDQPRRARAITNSSRRGVPHYRWTYDHQHILFIQDQHGNENFHVFCVNIDTLEVRDLTPFDDVAARIFGLSRRLTHEVVIGLNDRNPRAHDLYRVNILTGERVLLDQNDLGFMHYLVDNDLKPRIGIQMKSDGDVIWHRQSPIGWLEWQKVPHADEFTTQPLHITDDGRFLYMTDSRNRDTGALYRVNLESGESELLAEDARADFGRALAHPTTGHVEAACFCCEMDTWYVLDEGFAPDLERLRAFRRVAFMVSRTLDDRLWLIQCIHDDGPSRFYKYDRSDGRMEFLFSDRPALEHVTLARMESVTIPARDGLPLVSFLTKPIGATGPVPLVLAVHGGPLARDYWGWRREVQFLVNRGYAVLQVNFRGSTGFGKLHMNAGNLEWGRKMHHDLLDAVDWAVREGVTQRDTVAILGGSYGGYAALVGLTMTPDVFACGVAAVPPSNLIAWLESIPPHWEPLRADVRTRVGDERTEEGRAMLQERSPLTHVANIKKPLAIFHGANDARVKRSESDQIVNAMRERGIPVTYGLMPDEGHQFLRPENYLAFHAVVEAFLARHLGGQAEPIGTALENSSIEFLEGKDGIPGFPG